MIILSSFKKSFCLGLIGILSVFFAQAQSPSGPTSVATGSTQSYTYNDGFTYMIYSWQVTGGVKVSQSSSGTSYTVVVQWSTSPGSGSVGFNNNGNLLNVAITSGGASSLSQNKNYVHTTVPRVATTNITSLADDDKIETVGYFDELGWAAQSIAMRAGGQGEDIVTHMEYDSYGRQTKDFLPYAVTNGNGTFRTDALSKNKEYYYNNYSSDYYTNYPAVNLDTIVAYSEKEIESSPLNRVLKQGAPGETWKLGAGREIEFDFQTNTGAEVRYYKVTTTVNNGVFTPTLVIDAYYNAGELYKSITRDENHDGSSTKNNTTEEFTNTRGQVVLKRTYNNNMAHDTYYVYDDFGNLTYVLPPKSEPQSWKPNVTEIAELCYQYVYDNRNRLVEKKLPGKDWEHIVYNKLDLPVMTQDGNLDNQNIWLFTKYDAFGRVAYTGKTNNGSARSSLQDAANSSTYTSQYENVTSNSSNLAGTQVHYSNLTIPQTLAEVYTINYYGKYYDTNGGNSESSYGVTPETNVTGLPTVSKVRVLDTNDWHTTVSYYDDKARSIYTYHKNDYLNYTDKVKSKFDFAGLVEETTSTHSKTGQSTITSVDKYTYNQVGALSQTTNQINGGATEVIAENTYDGIGQLTQKSIGGKTNQNRLQDINYIYNVRGWLTDINNPDNKGSDLFAMRLYYDRDTHSTNATPLYNGNISQVMWSTKNTNSSKFYYYYHYDHLNRITKAQFAGGSWWDRYSLKNVEYDKNGNITKLERKGWTNSAATSFGTMDNLDYTYSSSGIGNQLLKVQDNTNINFGFKDVNQTTDYTYDSNGNMTRDYNKAINTNMTYNHLNLPTYIPINGGSISYYYDAAGVKQKKVVSGGATTEYAGNHIYTNNTLDQFFTAEGYVQKVVGSWDYNYLLKDHLGNTRIIFNDNNGTAAIKDENNYYPFGLEHKGYNDIVNGSEYEYKYNGKEFDQSHELDMYDYGARMYEPTLGRWMVIDALTEAYVNWTPYNYGFNNPSNFVDPDGNFVIDAATAKQYPNLKKAIELVVQELKKPENSDKLSELVRLGEFRSEQDFFNVFKDGEGPKLVVADLLEFTSTTTLDSNGNPVTVQGTELGVTGKALDQLIKQDGGEGLGDAVIGVTISKDDINGNGEIDHEESNVGIDDSVANSTNSIFKNNGKIRKDVLKKFMKVIVHEGVHVGDNKDKKPNSARGAGDEVGEKAEKVLGGIVPVENFRKYEPNN